jgi:hypothetical protein
MSGMRILPNVVGILALLFGCAWALAGFNYIRETSMSDSNVWAAIGLIVAMSGAMILASFNRSRFRLWRLKRSAT